MSTSFKDTKGRTWTIGVTVGTVRDVRKTCQVDLLTLADSAAEGVAVKDNLIIRIMADPMLLANILDIVCAEELEAAGVTSEEFGHSLGGDAIGEAGDALIEAIVNFFRDPRDRARAMKALDTIKQVISDGQDALDAAFDPEKIRDETRKTLAETLNADGT
jgi:hypothetical protein